MDEDYLLTVETLTLNREIVRGASVHGVQAWKTKAAEGYLVINEAQRVALEMFKTPQTVPQMLSSSILRRTCLELREFYELVLKAHRVGVLVSGPVVPVVTPLVRRWYGLPWKIPIYAAVAALAAVMGLLVWPPPTLPSAWHHWVVAWLTWCWGVSAGYALAASTLKDAGGQIFDPRWRWGSLTPHFTAQLHDACMLALPVRVSVLLARVAPLAVVAAIGLIWRAGWVVGPLVGLLVVTNPWRGPIADLRRLLGGIPQLGTDSHFVFSTNRLPRRQLRAFFRTETVRSASWALLGGLVWLWIAVRLVYAIADQPIVATLARWSVLGYVGGALAAGTLLAGLGLVTWCAVVLVRRRSHRLLARVRRQWGRWRNQGALVLSQSQLLRAMAQNPLLRSLNIDQQQAIARQFTLTRTKALGTLVAYDDQPTHVGLILRGSATLLLRTSNKVYLPLQRLKEGDLFGAHHLINRVHPQMEVRARTPVLALLLPASVFDQEVVRQIGPERAYCLVDMCSFLRSTRLCQQWHLTSITRLADIAQTKVYHASDKIVAVGEEPRSFFVIWEGTAEARSNHHPPRQLKSGDFFGEAELLQNSTVREDVVATSDVRCLCMPRSEFIRFVTHNYHVALGLERIASERLSRPVFPLQSSFEVR